VGKACGKSPGAPTLAPSDASLSDFLGGKPEMGSQARAQREHDGRRQPRGGHPVLGGQRHVQASDDDDSSVSTTIPYDRSASPQVNGLIRTHTCVQ